VGFIECRSVALMAEFDEEFADGQVAERGSKVQVGAGVAEGGVVGVVEEVRVRAEDALDKEGVVGTNGAAQPKSGIDPGRGGLAMG
jgi:hypothetical protein